MTTCVHCWCHRLVSLSFLTLQDSFIITLHGELRKAPPPENNGSNYREPRPGDG